MLIGISGKIGAGKDTLAECLSEIHYGGFENKKFADALKRAATIITGWEDQWSREGKAHYLENFGMTVGEFQQQLGKKMREIYPDVWIDALFAQYENKFHTMENCTGQHRHYQHCMPDWIVTDMRFPNEARTVRAHNGLLIRIDGTRTPDDPRPKNDISETALDDWAVWDYRFDNSVLTENELVDHAFAIYALAMSKKDGI